MRMWHYFLAGFLMLVPALLWTAFTGMSADDTERHLWAGLFTASLGVAVHTLLILFMIITGRVLKEAMRARPLGPEFLAELNEFFARKNAYPLAILGAFSLVVTGVLGFSQRGFGLSSTVHMLAGVLAVVLNLWALLEELKALRWNQVLVDRVADRLDELDRDQPELAAAAAAQDQAYDPARTIKWGLVLAISSWFPYLYWVLVNWRGDFSKVSIHPWLEGSILGLVIFWLGRRERRQAAEH